jgi:putative hydrolase of the HAD superfamily
MNAQQSAISAIFFDLDGTLFDHEYAARIANEQFWLRHGKPANMAQDEFIRLWERTIFSNMSKTASMSFMDHGPTSVQDLLRNLGREVPLQEAEHEFMRHLQSYEANWRLFDDAVGCLDALHDFHLGIVSNGDGAIQHAKLKRLDLSDRFHTVVLSGEFGVAKPDSAIFLHACQKAGAAPQNCIFVGDNFQADVLGSKHAGLRPVYIRRGAEKGAHVRVTALQDDGYHTVQDLAQVVRYIHSQSHPARS